MWVTGDYSTASENSVPGAILGQQIGEGRQKEQIGVPPSRSLYLAVETGQINTAAGPHQVFV